MLMIPVKATYLNKGKVLIGICFGWLLWAIFLADPLKIYTIAVDKFEVRAGDEIYVTASVDKPLWAVHLCTAVSSFNNIRDSHGKVWQEPTPRNFNDGSLRVGGMRMQLPVGVAEGPALVWRSVSYRCFGGIFRYTELPHRSSWATIQVEKRT